MASVYTWGTLFSLGVIGSAGECYPATEPYLNLQAAALRSGHLGLSRSAGSLAFDLAWAGDAVQQVWGLGVPGWILSLSLIFGVSDAVLFPSRIAFGIALLVLSSAVLLQAVQGIRFRLIQIEAWDWRFSVVLLPAVAIIWFFPSFTALLKSAFRVYEEVAAYGYLCAVFIGVVLAWFCSKVSGLRFLFLCLVSGSAPFVRPTIGIYGAAALAVGTWLAVRAGMRFSKIGGGAAVYAGMIGLLLWSNDTRFGSPWEFGHSLNVSYHSGSLYSTRFGSPYETESFFPALGEILGGLLFEGNFNREDWFENAVFGWQSHTLRWRDNYLPAIGWPMIGFAVLGSMVCFFVLRSENSRIKLPIVALVIYSALAVAALTSFYLRCPVISSRYFYDFSAAFAVSGACAWLCLAGWAVTNRGVIAVLAAVLGTGLCLYLCHRAQTAISREVDAVSCTKATYQRLLERTRKSVPSSASLSHNGEGVELNSGRFVGLLGIPFEGFGWWPRRGGEVSVCTTHFVRDMEFLELEITSVAAARTPSPKPEWIRAKVGLEDLARDSVEQLPGHRLRIRFKGPRNQDYRHGIQVLFVAWVPQEKLADELAPWRLHRFFWKRSAAGSEEHMPGTAVNH